MEYSQLVVKYLCVELTDCDCSLVVAVYSLVLLVSIEIDPLHLCFLILNVAVRSN